MENIIKFTVNQNEDGEIINSLANIVNATVEQNAELVAFTIDREVNGESVQFFLNTYTDNLLSLMLRDFEKDKLLALVSSGVLYRLRKLLEDELLPFNTKSNRK